MNALTAVHGELFRLGYRSDALLRDYVFADVLSQESADRSVDLAAFTQVPPSYRNAAIGVVNVTSSDASEIIASRRSLGAPLFFAISEKSVEVWQVLSSGQPQKLATTTLATLPQLFAAEQDHWNPDAIQRAKSIGPVEQGYQLDFVDLGLLPAIEGQIHAKLDRILRDVLNDTRSRIARQSANAPDDRLLLRTTFRLIAAKILADRGHEVSARWDPNNLETVLRVIGTHYTLPVPTTATSAIVSAFTPAWDQLRAGMSFRNISADDLAFVYENTLVTGDTRKHFGTHSTPRQVADYVVRQLELWRHEPKALRVYEPFTGAGAFLVAAVRQLKETLPRAWDPKDQHDFLIERVAGDELDAFAREVAMLSLILADYPNTNGWKIREQNLFVDDTLATRAAEHNIVLCNPPFESFTAGERRQYGDATARSNSKALAALDAVLDTHPLAVGFVLPEKFVSGQTGLEQRRRIEALYGAVEVVQLPDRIFKASVIRSCLVIARERREAKSRTILLTSTEVSVADRERFLATGVVSERRQHHGWVKPESHGTLWVTRLQELWEYLDHAPRLGSLVTTKKGLEWWNSQSEHVSTSRKAGYRRGVHRSGELEQFACLNTSWLDFNRDQIRCGAEFNWRADKIVATASQLSRGPWCFAACYDQTSELLCSQQLLAIWLKPQSRFSYETLLAILNSPLANAFLSEHSPKDRFRIATLESMPLPERFARELDLAVRAYLELTSAQRDREGQSLLKQIDALVLWSYNLPPRLERRLLEFFRGYQRPVPHDWSDWFSADFVPTIPLSEYMSADFRRAASDALPESLRGLSPEAAAALNSYLD